MCVRMSIHRTFYSLQLLPVPSAYSERHCSTFALFPRWVQRNLNLKDSVSFPSREPFLFRGPEICDTKKKPYKKGGKDFEGREKVFLPPVFGLPSLSAERAVGVIKFLAATESLKSWGGKDTFEIWKPLTSDKDDFRREPSEVTAAIVQGPIYLKHRPPILVNCLRTFQY